MTPVVPQETPFPSHTVLSRQGPWRCWLLAVPLRTRGLSEPPSSVSEVNACKTLRTACTGECPTTAESGQDGDNPHKGHDTPTAFPVCFQITVKKNWNNGGDVCVNSTVDF